jgi:hypothetical protein
MDFRNKLECLSLAPTLPANIRLGWKGLPGTNTLAYYENSQIISVISFIVQAPVDYQDSLEFPHLLSHLFTCAKTMNGSDFT